MFRLPAFIVLGIVAVIAGFSGPLYLAPDVLQVRAQLPGATAVFETSLQSAITSSATSMTLTANSVRGGGSISGYNCFTIDEGSAQAEFVCGTVSSTAVSSLTRGISPLTGTTTDTDLQFAHRRGANVKITDFPIVQILKAQNNGEDTFPNLLTYANTVLLGVGSPTTTIPTKYYVDTQIASGCSFADLVTKGCVEIATQTEAASSTSLGSTLSTLVLPASMATDTPNSATRASRVLMSDMGGYLKQSWINLTEAFTWTGHNIFSSAFITNASTTNATTTNQHITGILSSILKTDANGRVSGATAGTDYVVPSMVLATTTNIAPGGSGYATSTGGLTIPANTLNANSTIEFRYMMSACASASSGSGTVYLRTSSGATIASVAAVSDTSSNTGYSGTGTMVVTSNNSATFASQITTGSNITGIGATPTSVDIASIEASSAVDFTQQQVLYAVAQGSSCDSTAPVLNSFSIIVRP